MPRNKRRYDHMLPKRKFTCLNCGEVLEEGNGHFMPPSCGEPGIWFCEELNDET